MKNYMLIENKKLNIKEVDFTSNILEISHIKNKKHPYKKYYITQIRNNLDHKVKITKFGGYYIEGNYLILNNIIDSYYSHEQFNEWYFVKNNGWISPNEVVSDPNNYGGQGNWIYFCEDEKGNTFIIGK